MRDFRACHPQHTTDCSFLFRSESALPCRQLLLIRSVGSSSAWRTPFRAHLLTSSFPSFISSQTSRCIRVYVRFWPRLCKNAKWTACRRHSASQNALQGVFSRSGMVKRPLKKRRSRVFTQPGPITGIRTVECTIPLLSIQAPASPGILDISL